MQDFLDDKAIAALRTEQRNPDTIGIADMPTLEMLQAINDLDHMVAPAVREALPAVEQAIDLIVPRLQEGGRLVYVGAGTSGRLGFMDAAECGPTYGNQQIACIMAGGRDAVFQSQESLEDTRNIAPQDLMAFGLTSKDVVLAAAASGRTPYCISALDCAATLGAGRIALSCNLNAPMSQHADVAIEVDTGPEAVMGSTRMKAGTAQKLVINMISTAVMIRLGRTYDNLMIMINCKNQKANNRAERLFMEATQISDRAFASEMLSQADGQVAIATLMALCHVPASQAHAALVANHGCFIKTLAALQKG